MKKYLLVVAFCCLVAACNRPMLKLPGTQTPAIIKSEADITKTTAPNILPSALSTPSDTPTLEPTRVPTSIYKPTHTLVPVLTNTPQPTPTLYPTPIWCPVEPAPPKDSGILRLVYASQDKLFLKDEASAAVQLTQSGGIGQISISNDGQIIVFTRQSDENHAELWAINTDGSNERRVVSSDELATLDGNTDALGVLTTGLMWEPGTHHLLFGTYPVYDGIWIYEPSTYWLLNTDTNTVSAAPYSGGYIAYSPDRKQAVIYNITGLSLVNIDGSNLRENILPGYHGIGEGEGYYHPRPHWASDSTSLLVALPDQDDMYSDKGTVTVWRVPVAGKPAKLGQWMAFAPSVQFSPDQTYLSYWLWPQPMKNLRELHLVQLLGSTPANGNDTVYISDYLASDVVWSPDSQHFMFSIGDPEDKMQLYLGHICQRPQLLSESTTSWEASWVDSSRYLLKANSLDSTDLQELRMGRIGHDQLDVIGVVTSYAWIILP
jgi:hypothetical protein